MPSPCALELKPQLRATLVQQGSAHRRGQPQLHQSAVPQLHTFVNAYGPTRAHIRAAIEKICGKSEFMGTAGETVFCGRWDTRL